MKGIFYWILGLIQTSLMLLVDFHSVFMHVDYFLSTVVLSIKCYFFTSFGQIIRTLCKVHLLRLLFFFICFSSPSAALRFWQPTHWGCIAVRLGILVLFIISLTYDSWISIKQLLITYIKGRQYLIVLYGLIGLHKDGIPIQYLRFHKFIGVLFVFLSHICQGWELFLLMFVLMVLDAYVLCAEVEQRCVIWRFMHLLTNLIGISVKIKLFVSGTVIIVNIWPFGINEFEALATLRLVNIGDIILSIHARHSCNECKLWLFHYVFLLPSITPNTFMVHFGYFLFLN